MPESVLSMESQLVREELLSAAPGCFRRSQLSPLSSLHSSDSARYSHVIKQHNDGFGMHEKYFPDDFKYKKTKKQFFNICQYTILYAQSGLPKPGFFGGEPEPYFFPAPALAPTPIPIPTRL